MEKQALAVRLTLVPDPLVLRPHWCQIVRPAGGPGARPLIPNCKRKMNKK